MSSYNHRSTKYGREHRSQLDKYREQQASSAVSIDMSDYHEQEEDEQQTVEFFCNNCNCRLATVEGDDAAHCYHCNSTWSISKDNLRTIGLRVTEQDSLDDDDSNEAQEYLISVTDPMDLLMGKDTATASTEDDSKVKIKGALASLQDNTGTIRVYDYTERSGSGKVLHSFSKGSNSRKGTAK
jgi:hypothetical protein